MCVRVLARGPRGVTPGDRDGGDYFATLKRVLRRRLVGLPGTQHHRREVRLVRRVRVVLRLQAQPAALDVGLAAAALDRSIQEVAGVELHARLGGGDLHDPAADRIGDARAHRMVPGGCAEHEVVVVAPAKPDLLVVGVDELADPPRLGEVKRRARHRAQFAGGDQPLVDRRVLVGEHLQRVVQDRRRGAGRQVEVRVVA